MNTKKVPFDIYIPASEHREAIKVAEIEIEVLVDASGQEMVTPESSELIDKTQARYMGILAGADIKALRKKLELSQDQLSDLIGCGKKSVSRWENGHEYPSQVINTLLRLMEDGYVDLHTIQSTRQRRAVDCDNVIRFIEQRREAPKTYDLAHGWGRSSKQNLSDSIPQQA